MTCWRAHGVKVISLLGKLSSGISKGCRIGLKKKYLMSSSFKWFIQTFYIYAIVCNNPGASIMLFCFYDSKRVAKSKLGDQIFLKQSESWGFLWDHIELILKCNHANPLQTLTLCLHFAASQEEWTETFVGTYTHKVIAYWFLFLADST